MVTKKTFGDLQVGDYIPGTDGWTQVTKAYDHHIPEKMYKIVLDDADSTTVHLSGSHLVYIETDIDRDDFRNRISTSKKALKGLNSSAISFLEELAEDESSDVRFEVTLDYMVTTLSLDTSSKAASVLSRVAEAVGPISETHWTIQNPETGEVEGESITGAIRGYDGANFAQQILALTGNKKYPWKVIVGRVLTVDELVHVYQHANIPVLDDKITQMVTRNSMAVA